MSICTSDGRAKQPPQKSREGKANRWMPQLAKQILQKVAEDAPSSWTKDELAQFTSDEMAEQMASEPDYFKKFLRMWIAYKSVPGLVEKYSEQHAIDLLPLHKTAIDTEAKLEILAKLFNIILANTDDPRQKTLLKDITELKSELRPMRWARNGVI